MTATTSFECSPGLISVFIGRFKMCDMHDSDWKLLNIFQAQGWKLSYIFHGSAFSLSKEVSSLNDRVEPISTEDPFRWD